MAKRVHRLSTTRVAVSCLCLVALGVLGPIRRPAQAEATSPPAASQGQVVYVPAYSHVFRGDRGRPFPLTVSLSIRNTDPVKALRVVDVEYRGDNGKLLREYVRRPLTLGPLSSTHFVVQESDVSGGVGASFLVTWRSGGPMSPPILESVMIGTQGQQGVSFTSRGQVIQELNP